MFEKCGFDRSVNGEVQNRKVRRKAMNRNQIHSILLSAFAIVVALIASRPAAAQDAIISTYQPNGPLRTGTMGE
jgi:hypothetical protein